MSIISHRIVPLDLLLLLRLLRARRHRCPMCCPLSSSFGTSNVAWHVATCREALAAVLALREMSFNSIFISLLYFSGSGKIAFTINQPWL